MTEDGMVGWHHQLNGHEFKQAPGNSNPLQCSCLENPRDGGPGGLPSLGSHRNDAKAETPVLWPPDVKN